MPELNSKWSKLGTKGLVVIGVTDEDPALVDAWVAKNKPDYPIAILGSGKFQGALGLKGFPHAAVIGPDGKLSYTGSAWEYSTVLEEALEGATKGPVSAKSLSKATKLMLSGELSKCYAEVLKVLESSKLEERERAQAEYFREFLEARGAEALADAQSLQTTLVYRAVALVEPLAEADPPFPQTAPCKELLATLEALPDFKLEMKGGKAFAAAQEVHDEGEYTEAAKAYLKVADKYEGLRVGATALARARTLITKRLTGYVKTCPKCKQARRACDKHHEVVKY